MCREQQHLAADSTGVANANVIDISKFDGDKITGFAKYQDALIIFKERSIYQLTFDASSGVPSILPCLKQLRLCVSPDD
jgi:hypothetical protein